MLLAEKIFILTINEKTGKIKKPLFFDYAIIGAVLLELLFLKKIILEKKTFRVLVHLVDSSATKIKPLDYFLQEFSKMSGSKSLEHWIRKFAMYDAVKPMEVIFETIQEHGIIRNTSNEPQLSFHKTETFPLTNPGVKQEILEEVKIVFTSNIQPDNISLALLSLLYATHSLKNFFERKDRKLARKKMKDLLAKREKSLLKKYSDGIYYVTKTIRSIVSTVYA